VRAAGRQDGQGPACRGLAREWLAWQTHPRQGVYVDRTMALDKENQATNGVRDATFQIFRRDPSLESGQASCRADWRDTQPIVDFGMNPHDPIAHILSCRCRVMQPGEDDRRRLHCRHVEVLEPHVTGGCFCLASP
jgi:hypothetical protein